jgi:hypothetical protein
MKASSSLPWKGHGVVNIGELTGLRYPAALPR